MSVHKQLDCRAMDCCRSRAQSGGRTASDGRAGRFGLPLAVALAAAFALHDAPAAGEAVRFAAAPKAAGAGGTSGSSSRRTARPTRSLTSSTRRARWCATWPRASSAKALGAAEAPAWPSRWSGTARTTPAGPRPAGVQGRVALGLRPAFDRMIGHNPMTIARCGPGHRPGRHRLRLQHLRALRLGIEATDGPALDRDGKYLGRSCPTRPTCGGEAQGSQGVESPRASERPLSFYNGETRGLIRAGRTEHGVSAAWSPATAGWASRHHRDLGQGPNRPRRCSSGTTQRAGPGLGPVLSGTAQAGQSWALSPVREDYLPADLIVARRSTASARHGLLLRMGRQGGPSRSSAPGWRAALGGGGQGRQRLRG